MFLCLIRVGCSISFLARSEFLRVLYDSYPEKAKIVAGKRVDLVKGHTDGICAITDDGRIYEGSIIVGTDGVHSLVRSEIWRAVDENLPGAITPKEKECQCYQDLQFFWHCSHCSSIELI